MDKENVNQDWDCRVTELFDPDRVELRFSFPGFETQATYTLDKKGHEEHYDWFLKRAREFGYLFGELNYLVEEEGPVVTVK